MRIKKKTSEFFYKNIFYLGSSLWAGNVIEYFIKNSHKLVVFYFLPRWEKRRNFVRVFVKGKLIREYSLFSPKNIFIQYLFLPIQISLVIIRNFKKEESFYAITYHPIFFPIKYFLRYMRNFEIVFWIADYIKNGDSFKKLFQFFTSYYQKRNKYNFYLSDRINKVMNEEIRRKPTNHTVMLGVKPFSIKNKKIQKRVTKKIRLFYIGVIKESHGMTLLLRLLEKNKNIKVKILGSCEEKMFRRYRKIISKKKLSSQVYFPNKYFSDEEIKTYAKNCNIGIALYPDNNENIHYYADPGKIKFYSQLGLPIIMSDSAGIAKYIKKFKAGEVIRLNLDSFQQSVDKISKNYFSYIQGLRRFCEYFDFEKYYRRKMIFMEK